MISVYEAIERGRRQLVVIPMGIVLVGYVTIGIVLLSEFFSNPWWGIGATILLLPVLALIWRRYFFPEWLQWAFSQVADVHLLDARASTNWLLWMQEKTYRETVIRFKNGESKRIEELLAQEKNPEIILDKNLPAELQLRAEGQGKYLLYMGCLMILPALAVKDTGMLFLLPIGFFIWGAVIRNREKTKPHILLTASEQGLLINGLNFPWEKIKNWTFVNRAYGSSMRTFLKIETTLKRKPKLEILLMDSMNVSRRELEYHLDVYQSKHRIRNS